MHMGEHEKIRTIFEEKGSNNVEGGFRRQKFGKRNAQASEPLEKTLGQKNVKK